MRAVRPALALAALLAPAFAAVALHAAPADSFEVPPEAVASEAPKRMKGLWLLETLPLERAGSAPQYHLCIAAGSDDPLAFPGSELSNCREVRWARHRLQRYYSARCDLAGSTTTVSGRFVGDFEYNYQGELLLSRGSAAPVRIELGGRRLGPCKGGLPEGKFLVQGRDGIGNLNIGGLDAGNSTTPAR